MSGLGVIISSENIKQRHTFQFASLIILIVVGSFKQQIC